MLDKIIYCSLRAHTVEEGGARKVLCCGTIAAAGAGAERFTCYTVATAGADASPVVLSSHCCSMTAVLGLDE